MLVGTNDEGLSVGSCVLGYSVGCNEVKAVGVTVGQVDVGNSVGGDEGRQVGCTDGEGVGFNVGDLVGSMVG